MVNWQPFQPVLWRFFYFSQPDALQIRSLYSTILLGFSQSFQNNVIIIQFSSRNHMVMYFEELSSPGFLKIAEGMLCTLCHNLAKFEILFSFSPLTCGPWAWNKIGWSEMIYFSSPLGRLSRILPVSLFPQPFPRASSHFWLVWSESHLTVLLVLMNSIGQWLDHWLKLGRMSAISRIWASGRQAADTLGHCFDNGRLCSSQK